ncbi:MAG: mucoidy inhibitor MuiA family protein, partial [Verrucomicrobiota bacterium]
MMLTKTLLLTVLACLALPFLNFAADEVVDAEITAVTVYTDRAEVTRSAKLTLPAGDHTLVFNDLPRAVQRNSLQVDGSGAFTLQDVRFLTEQVTEVDGKLQELLDEEQRLQDEQRALKLSAERIAAMRKALDDVLSRITTTPQEYAGEAPMDAVKWTEMLTFYNVQNEKLDQSVLENDRVKRENAGALNRVQREIRQLNANRKPISNAAHVLVSLDADAEIAVQLSYLVTGPRWYPSYDIRANSSSGQVGITYYGNVTQNTGEDWQDAKLSLSTAQPQIGGREPELSPWFISEYLFEPPMSSPVVAERRLKVSGELDEELSYDGFAPAPAQSPMALNTANIQAGATAVVYKIPGTTVIPSDNQPVRLTVARE